MDWFRRIISTPGLGELAGGIESGSGGSARGVMGSSTALVAAGLGQLGKRPVLLVVAHLDDADEAVDELGGLGNERFETVRFPVMEALPGESAVNMELLSERLTLVRRLGEGDVPAVMVAPFAALMQHIPSAEGLSRVMRVLKRGGTIEPGELAGWLTEAGYARVEMIESPGEFAIRGDIFDLYPPGGVAARIDLFGDAIESIRAIDLDTMGSDRALDSFEIIGASTERIQSDESECSLMDCLPGNCVGVLADIGELTEQGRSYFDRAADSRAIFGPPEVFKRVQERCHCVIDINPFSSGSQTERVVELPVSALPHFSESAADAVQELAGMAETQEVVVLCENEGEVGRMRELAEEVAAGVSIEVVTQYLHRGFIWQEGTEAQRQEGTEAQRQEGTEAQRHGGVEDDRDLGRLPLALVPYHELLHRYHTRRRIRRGAGGAGIGTPGVGGKVIDAFLDLSPGDFVVHRDHGIALYAGLRVLKAGRDRPAGEYLTLEFAKSVKLNVPVAHIDLVQKYIGAFTGKPKLSALGGKRWKHQKEKVGEAVRDLAAEMLRMQAVRESMPGIRYPADTPWQHEFEAEFPYEETEDQLTAAAAVKKDMQGERPMDRLICGDVGFGKTEVAIRGAFKAVEYGKQVAILVPTTVLAEQHERTFRERFADYPFRIESLSRFKTREEQKITLKAITTGAVDILIGTHRILSKDIRFADLGLVIIDEEQRFGVEHKQKLLAFRATADVLTLTATPIPRTLHMSLIGLRDISSLTTAPLDRRAIVTEVIPFNKNRIKRAMARELAREGQIFFVHNRVHNIQSVADEVGKLAPGAKVIIGHGQMPPRELEKVMLDFMRGRADILVSTTIIESGIDIPRANTMFVNDAHIFGLSELHQLRGRVGRSKHRAYCYLLLSPDKTINEVAMKRLQSLEDFSMLGAGFKIALRDLEIRGAGNLLGAEQSGHIAVVGYEMYCQLLEHAVAELKNEVKPVAIDTTLDLGITGVIPKGYIPSDARRLDAYRRLSRANDVNAVAAIEKDMISAYGEPPETTRRLIRLAEVRVAAAALGIQSISRHEQDIIFRTDKPRKLEKRMKGIRGTVRLVGHPDSSGVAQVYFRPPASFLESDTLLTVLRRRLVGEAQRHEGTKAQRQSPAGTEA